jgi:hypothetical protein
MPIHSATDAVHAHVRSTLISSPLRFCFLPPDGVCLFHLCSLMVDWNMWRYLSLVPTLLATATATANPKIRLKTSKHPLPTSSAKC